jgi:hypothetical protein
MKMAEQNANVPAKRIEDAIFLIRGKRVILDADLAVLYEVETKRLNEAVKRNADRFPDDFGFRLTRQELECLKSQIATSGSALNRSQFATGSQKHRDPRYLPYAFTEHGAIMAANVLNCPRAVEMSVFVVRAFIRMRSMLADTKELARRLAALEKELKERLDVHESAIVSILQRVLDIIDPPALPNNPPRKRIGFGVKEPEASYGVRCSGSKESGQI